MDDIKQIDIKVFVEDAGDVKATEFVAVLQRWIQEHAVPGTLIDVADYSHIRNGAGVILVGHQYNLSIDYVDGRMGLLVHYKLPSEDTFEARVESALKLAFESAARLEEEGEFKARLKFGRNAFRFMISDRLHAPNTDDTYTQLAPAVEAAAKALTGSDATLTRVNEDGRDRMIIDVTTTSDVAAGSPA